VESLRNRLGADLGIDDDQLLIASLSLPEEDYDRERGEALFRELQERAAALPGVESAAFAMIVPPLLFDVTVLVGLPGEADDVATIRLNFVDREYFGAVGIPLLRGRLFEPTDGPESRAVVVVNQRLAATLWPGEEALGRTLRMKGSPDDPGPDHQVIGVVTNVSQHGVHPGGEPLAYFSYRQRYRPSRQLVVRSAREGTPQAEEALAESLRVTLRELDPELALTSIRNGEKNRRNAFIFERMQTQAVGVFAVLGFVLAVVGIFGLLSHAVSLRVREIGIRMAVGARAADVRRQVVGEGLRMALLGAAVGLLATLAAGRFLDSLLYGVSATEPWVMAAVTVVAVASSAAAAYLPARRAARLDPLDALRYE
jgi:predicted permease